MSFRPLIRLTLPLTLLIALLAGCQTIPFLSKPTPTPTATLTRTPTPSITATPAPEVVRVDPSVPHQTLREVGGGNFIHRFGEITTALDPISTLNQGAFHPSIVRVQLDLAEWEPKPGMPSAERFHDDNHVHATFEFLQQLKTKSPNVQVIASIWDAPNWMVSNPDKTDNRLLAPGSINAVIDSIAEWLLTTRNQYGVEVDYLSFNEANIGINIALTPQEQINFIRKAGPAFRDRGLKTRWLLGDTGSAAAASSYIPPIFAAEDIRPYLGPLSFHSWDYASDDSVFRAIGQFADQNKLEVWCTEAGWDPSEWQRPEDFATWKHALNLANIYTRVLRDTRATSVLYWQMTGKDYAINDGTLGFPAYLYILEMQKHFPAGAQIVKSPDDPIQTISLLTLAARLPKEGFSAQILNQINERRPIRLMGLPDGKYSMVRLSEADQGRKQLESILVRGGEVPLILPPKSITFFSLEK